MERIEIQKYESKSIVLVDLSKLKPDETIKILPEAQKIISKMGEKSALILTDVTGANYNREVADGIKEFVKNNSPYVKASAVVGVEGISDVLLQTVIFLSRREIKSFNNRVDATNWLLTH